MSGWVRLGHLYTLPDGGLHPQMLSHAANPLAHPLASDVVRIFFNSRDADNCSSIGAVDIDIVARTVVRVFDRPLVTPDSADSFYVDGLSIGGWIDRDDGRALLFMGWKILGGGRWRGTIGSVAMRDDAMPDPARITPELAPDGAVDPLSLSYPCILRDADGGYRMLYESTTAEPKRHPLHSAASHNGRNWQREGVALAPVPGVTTGYSRPTLLNEPGHPLWFSQTGAAGERYRIGHATSGDGRTWTLADGGGLDPAGDGWESRMVCYPHVFVHGGARYMLYNGNDYGRSGFGLAMWDAT